MSSIVFSFYFSFSYLSDVFFQQLQSNDDMTGTIVTATSPVAVFGGALWTSVGHSTMGDHLVEQIPPDESWGKEFFVIAVARRKAGDIIRILGTLLKCFLL